MIAIIDYGAGNLRSVVNAVRFIGCDTKIIQTPEELSEADGVILPGVGAFGDAMRCLRESRLAEAIPGYIRSGKPLLGICIGLQMLFEESEENPGIPGLGIYKGKIVRIPAGEGIKIPHMGWNSIKAQKESLLFRGIKEDSYVYFVHSYYLRSENRSIVTARTEYGVEIDAAIGAGNVFATQFHPEKSGEVGIRMLRNYIEFVEGRN